MILMEQSGFHDTRKIEETSIVCFFQFFCSAYFFLLIGIVLFSFFVFSFSVLFRCHLVLTYHIMLCINDVFVKKRA